MIHRSIAKISAQQLFGSYDYELFPSEAASESNRLLILYGDNGTGKTTVLRVLFHLISPESRQGHKTTLVRIPLSKFEVQFANGDRVWMRRPDGKLTGSYTMGFKVGRRKEQVADFIPDEDGGIKPNPNTQEFLRKLKSLDLAIYFLSDDRSVRFAGVGDPESDHYFDDYTNEGISFDYVEEEISSMRDFPTHRDHWRPSQSIEERTHLLLHRSIRRSEQWLQSQAVRGASQGESNVNVLYSEILRRISGIPLSSEGTSTSKIDTIFTRIEELETRSGNFAKYKLTPSFQGGDIIQAIKKTPDTHVSIVMTVIESYIESVERKLDAMQDLQKWIDTLVDRMNSFYHDKRISYDVHAGFTITTKSGNPLSPQMLSSGERHLLLLFCNTVQALNKPSIFLIDEPEISLNVKWQRRLLSALLKCSEGQPVQYVLATHSLELLAQHRNNTVKLKHSQERPSGTEEA